MYLGSAGLSMTAEAGAHLQGREEAVGHRRHVYDSPKEAAIQRAIAHKEMAKGFGGLYSPLKRQTTGAHTL
jgi:hypothetical protein